MTDLLHPELASYAQQFRENGKRAQTLIGELTPAQFNWRPGPKRWSVGDCFEHLNITARKVSVQMRAAIEAGRARGLTSNGPYSYGWFSRWFMKTMEPPVKRRFRTPPAFGPAPGSTHDPQASLAEFLRLGEEWQRILVAANGVDLGRIKVPSPAATWIRFNLGAYMAAQAAHERRHMWQAEQVLLAPGFPSAEERKSESVEQGA